MNQMRSEPAVRSIGKLFAYKAWANDELFAALAAIDPDAHRGDVHGAIRILNHVHVVDRIFKAHLEGVAHGYAATNTAETPDLAALAVSVRAVDAWFIAYVTGLSMELLGQRLDFEFTDGDRGRMTREEMLLHVVTHGGYHRGAAGQLMRHAGTAPPRDLYTRFLHTSEPARRG